MFEFVYHNLTGFLFAFIPALFSFGLVLYIQTALPRNRLVDVFTALTFCCGLWQLSDAMARISSNMIVAAFWDNVLSVGWIFVGAVCLHFALLYSKLFPGGIPQWILLVLYLPSLIFQGIYQSRVFRHEFIYSDFWGWVNYHNKSRIDSMMVMWFAFLIAAACCFVLAYAYRVRKDRLLASQALIIGIGLSIPIIGGGISQVVFPFILHKQAIPTTSYFLTFLSLATLIALRRYRLFTISELLNSELLLDELPVAVLSISDTGHITYMNKAGISMLGISRRGLSMYTVDRVMKHALPEDAAGFKAIYEKALAGEFVTDVESSFVIDGKTTHVAIAASPIVNNKQVRGALLCIRDITDLKMSVYLTQKNELSLKEAQEISHIGSWEWNMRTNSITWSDELCRIYGLPTDTTVTFDKIVDFVHPEDYQMVKERIAHVVSERTPVDFNYKIVLPEGVIKHLNAKLQIADDKFSGYPRLFGTVQDVTMQVETETSLQQKNVQLKQSNANLEEFVFVASHDLKEPIRKIITFSELISSGEKDTLSEKSQSYFERITKAAQRMQVMIDDLLALSVISQNNVFESYSLQILLEEVLQDLDLKIKEKHAVINCEKLPAILINPKQFRQLFLNLLNNSLKFAKADTQPVINIKSRMLTQKEVEQLSLIKGDNYLMLVFEDNGIGFDNAYADKIFQMFQRLHGKVDYEGTGIGLAVCKKVVENHKGIIYAHGDPGQGASFTIIIPVVKRSQRAAMIAAL
jgi:PAS domain S-box-containing protein